MLGSLKVMSNTSVYGMSQTGIQLSAKMLANLIQWPECDFVWGWHLHMRRHLYIRARRHLHIRAHFTCHLLKRFISFSYLFECKRTHHINRMHGDNKTHKLTKIKSYSAVMNYCIQKGIYNDIDCVWGRHENMGEEREEGYMKTFQLHRCDGTALKIFVKARYQINFIWTHGMTAENVYIAADRTALKIFVKTIYQSTFLCESRVWRCKVVTAEPKKNRRNSWPLIPCDGFIDNPY